MARVKVGYQKLIQMAETYSVDSNPLFISAAHQYVCIQKVIARVQQDLEKGETTTEKEYVKGRENLCVNPLLKELPKLIDSANKTLGTMMDIILKLGKEPAQRDELTDFLDE